MASIILCGGGLLVATIGAIVFGFAYDKSAFLQITVARLLMTVGVVAITVGAMIQTL